MNTSNTSNKKNEIKKQNDFKSWPVYLVFALVFLCAMAWLLNSERSPSASHGAKPNTRFMAQSHLGTKEAGIKEHGIKAASPKESGTKESSAKEAGVTRVFVDSQATSKLDKIEDEPSVLFNDPAISQAWGLKKADVARAWAVTKGSRDIVVAVIDTGADIQHEDLEKNIWNNPGESGKDAKGKDKSNNGIDDDKNGFIDDVHGWNFVSNNNSLIDNHGHGTHIAGIIGAEAGNKKGISGIAPEVSLMILKYYDPKVPGADNLKNTIKAMKYAVSMGAQIINYSGGGTEYSQDEHDAVAEAEKKGILFVAAAGNERSNSDKFHYYPADYKLKNIISTTAIDSSTEVLSSSNYGIETVDIAAPGKDIESCLPGNAYGKMTGTSQATAFVTGAAALVMAHKQSFQAEDIRKYILETGDAVNSLAGKTRYARQLNMFKALTILDKGISATGVTAVNTGSMGNDFTADPTQLQKDSNPKNNDFSRFGKSLLNAIEKGGVAPPNSPKTKERIGSKKEDSD